MESLLSLLRTLWAQADLNPRATGVWPTTLRRSMGHKASVQSVGTLAHIARAFLQP